MKDTGESGSSVHKTTERIGPAVPPALKFIDAVPTIFARRRKVAMLSAPVVKAKRGYAKPQCAPLRRRLLPFYGRAERLIPVS
jgi:hypothetical protein